MSDYVIIKLNDGRYNAFLLCLTFESILNYLESIEKELIIQQNHGNILIDQLLVTGNGPNRFLSCFFSHGKLDISSAHAATPGTHYRELSLRLLQRNYSSLRNSILTNQQRDNIKRGIPIQTKSGSVTFGLNRRRRSRSVMEKCSKQLFVPFKSEHTIILPLHGKAATGGFFARFEP